MLFKEKMTISYKNYVGCINFVGNQYITFRPENSQALLLVYKEQWDDVTVLKLSTTP